MRDIKYKRKAMGYIKEDLFKRSGSFGTEETVLEVFGLTDKKTLKELTGTTEKSLIFEVRPWDVRQIITKGIKAGALEGSVKEASTLTEIIVTPHELFEKAANETLSGSLKQRFGSHASRQVIRNEAALAYMMGDEVFQASWAMRKTETSCIKGSLTREELVALGKQARKKRTELRILEKQRNDLINQPVDDYEEYLKKSEEISAQAEELYKTNYMQDFKNQVYKARVDDIYTTTPKGIEDQLKEKGLRRFTREDYESLLGRDSARVERFRKVSTEAVGVGHRAAHNAGRKHTGYASTKSA
jgi:hypothetical protein